jgi:uncharacterized lipoprotein YehR (DUF1307 family)
MNKRFPALIAVMLTLCLMLTACGEPSGTYKYAGDKSIGAMGNEIEFDGDKLTYLGMVVVTYKIEGDKLTLSDESSGIGVSYDYKKDGDSIFINGDEYVKQ